MIELELTAVESMPASNFAPAQIDLLHVRFDHVDVAQDAAQRVYDVARGKIARRDFMQHRRKQNEVLPRDDRHLDVRPTREMVVEIFCRVEPGEAAACDHDPRFFMRKSSRARALL